MNKKIFGYILVGLMVLVIITSLFFIDDQGGLIDVLLNSGGLVLGLFAFFLLVAMNIFLFGGFIWLIANGNEDEVKRAKKFIVFGLISLVMIIFTFVIVTFVDLRS